MLSVVLEITPDLATRAIETPLSSSIGTMWCLCDPTPFGWERTCLRLFQFFLRDQASNWLERLPAGSISTWEDLTTRFLAQFFPPKRTSKLRNDILMFQQHQVQIFYDHVNPATRTINQSAGGKLRDKNAKESWALLEDLALYDNETHLAPKSHVQVNKIASSCEICSGPHDTQYCMENPEQAFVEYASSRTDEAGDARLSKFEAYFKQQQGKMTNKIDAFLKAINDRMTRALPSDTLKNPKLNVNPTSSVLSARSYLTYDPESSSRPLNSINAIKTTRKALEDEFKDLHLNLPVLEVLAHAPMYDAILDTYVESLELGKNGSAFIQGIMLEKMKDLRLFTLPYSLGDSKPFDTLADLGSCVNLIPLYLFKKLKIGLLEETGHVFRLADRTKSYTVTSENFRNFE
ncbi:zinc finger, CCHC-type containing protein [Tanacetum coccineum]